MKDKIIVVTGASSGIGWATAKVFSQHGAKLILCGRRKEKLELLASKLKTKSLLLTFDVRDRRAVFEALENLPKEWENVDVLINNAGNAHGFDPVQTASLEDWDAMIDGNVKGLMYVTKALLPQMIKAKKGHIINLGSIAGKEVYPNGSVYCSSKFAVDAFTQGLRLDLNKDGIKVGAIHPGLVETEFSKVRFKGDAIANSVYKGFKALQAKDIAEIIYFAVSRPPHVNIADLLVFPTAQANSVTVKKEF